MLKTISAAVVVSAVLACGAGAVLYLSYGLSDDPPVRVSVDGLGDSTRLVTHESGYASIQARSRQDAVTALGYAHAHEHAWTMTLWQRTARGRLSSWFGEELLPVDRTTRGLGLGTLAAAGYSNLSAAERELLEAYVRGVNAALMAPGALQSGEFSVLRMTAEPWEPWYPLAVERLFSWLAAEPPHPDSLRRAPEALRRFFDGDRLLREWLHIFGFDQSMAWTLQNSAGTRLVQRHVYGASALPVFHEVEITLSDDARFVGASLIGTPFFPAGRTETQAWAVLLSSSSEADPAMRDTSSAGLVFERITTREGSEHLLRVRRSAGELFFASDASLSDRTIPDTALVDSTADPAPAPAPAPDSAAGWSVRWAGLELFSDASAWFGLWGTNESAFQLFDGDGVVMNRNGSTRVVGNPLVTAAHARGTAVGNSPWSRFAAQRLDSLAAIGAPASDQDVWNDVHSTWAAELAPELTEAATAVPDQPGLVTEALAYLRNWDYAYDGASIAASIFDTWTNAYRDSLGRLPTASVPDTALGIHLVRYEVLLKAVASLAARFGDDPSQWRWEEVQPHRYNFPVWSADSLLSQDLSTLSKSRYAPIVVPGAGHATSLYHGPSSLRGAPDASARWESWVSTGSWNEYTYRTRRFSTNRLFGRYLVSDRSPEPTAVPDAEHRSYGTILVPE